MGAVWGQQLRPLSHPCLSLLPVGLASGTQSFIPPKCPNPMWRFIFAGPRQWPGWEQRSVGHCPVFLTVGKSLSPPRAVLATLSGLQVVGAEFRSSPQPQHATSWHLLHRSLRWAIRYVPSSSRPAPRVCQVGAGLPLRAGMGSLAANLQGCQLVLKLNCCELNLPIW